MDPIRQLTTPAAEVRLQSTREIDEYGEEWIVIDGIQTKVPNRKLAEKIMQQQDAARVQIREDLDARGLRDAVVEEEITLEDGTTTTVSLLPPGDAGANALQIETFPDLKTLIANADKAQKELDDETMMYLREEAARLRRSIQRWDSRPWYIKARDKIASIFRKEK